METPIKLEDKIEVIPEMIEAGCDVIWLELTGADLSPSFSASRLAKLVFQAMAEAVSSQAGTVNNVYVQGFGVICKRSGFQAIPLKLIKELSAFKFFFEFERPVMPKEPPRNKLNRVANSHGEGRMHNVIALVAELVDFSDQPFDLGEHFVMVRKDLRRRAKAAMFPWSPRDGLRATPLKTPVCFTSH